MNTPKYRRPKNSRERGIVNRVFSYREKKNQEFQNQLDAELEALKASLRADIYVELVCPIQTSFPQEYVDDIQYEEVEVIPISSACVFTQSIDNVVVDLDGFHLSPVPVDIDELPLSERLMCSELETCEVSCSVVFGQTEFQVIKDSYMNFYQSKESTDSYLDEFKEEYSSNSVHCAPPQDSIRVSDIELCHNGVEPKGKSIIYVGDYLSSRRFAKKIRKPILQLNQHEERNWTSLHISALVYRRDDLKVVSTKPGLLGSFRVSDDHRRLIDVGGNRHRVSLQDGIPYSGPSVCIRGRGPRKRRRF